MQATSIPRKRTQVIINSDDFGRSVGINAAIIQAHRQSVLTSTGLMVTANAADDAVALAQATPTLAVGPQLVLCAGRAALPASRIPHLLDSTGHFLGSAVQLGLRYALSPRAQQELAQELRAQFRLFAATRLSLSHVDGHWHMLVHPTVFRLMLPLAKHYGAPAVRLPRDDVWLALRYDRHQTLTKTALACVYDLLCRQCLRRLHDEHLATTDRVYGLMQSGRMEEGYVAQLLRSLDAPTAELYFHPSLGFEGETPGPNPGDLATLLSPTVRQVIRDRHLHLGTYPNQQA